MGLQGRRRVTGDRGKSRGGNSRGGEGGTDVGAGRAGADRARAEGAAVVLAAARRCARPAMQLRRKTLRSRGEQPVARRGEQGGAHGDRYRDHPAAGAALAQPRRFRQDLPDIEFGAALQACAEGPGLVRGRLTGEAEQVQIPVGHERGAGIQLLHPGEPANPDGHRLVHQSGDADAVREVLPDQQPVQGDDRFDRGCRSRPRRPGRR